MIAKAVTGNAGKTENNEEHEIIAPLVLVFFYEESINYSRFVIHMQFFLQRLLEDLLQKEITEEERVYLIVHISRTTQKQ